MFMIKDYYVVRLALVSQMLHTKNRSAEKFCQETQDAVPYAPFRVGFLFHLVLRSFGDGAL